MEADIRTQDERHAPHGECPHSCDHLPGTPRPGGRAAGANAVPGIDRWTLVFYTTPDTEPARMFQNLTHVATGTGEFERVLDPLEQFTMSTEGDSSGF